ncbi:MAG: protein-export chaperone SecB [Deltaproteobacteria bacterium]|nr:protein-export chaperone SecB [Deltaproteobacteria bacterium]
MEANQAGAPVFRLQKIYLKDLSFESPGAPEVFFTQVEPQVKIDLSVSNRKLDEEHWEVVLHVNATVTAGEATLFIVEVEHAGAFLIKDIPEEHLAGILSVDCPTAIFPFTRQVLSQATIDGGFAPFLLEPVNFLALYQKARSEQEQEAKH